MRAEGDAGFVQLAQFGERHDLEAAGIGEDRAWPQSIILCKPPRRADTLGRGAEHEVIGVAEDDLAPVAPHGIRGHGL